MDNPVRMASHSPERAHPEVQEGGAGAQADLVAVDLVAADSGAAGVDLAEVDLGAVDEAVLAAQEMGSVEMALILGTGRIAGGRASTARHRSA
jgi:hypothetical protein